MEKHRTQLEWDYSPTDFFEVPFQLSAPRWDVRIEGGRVVVSLGTPQDPVPEEMERQIQAELQRIFRGRQLSLHRDFDLRGPRCRQIGPDGVRTQVRIQGAGEVSVAGSADIVVVLGGKVVHDSKAERIAAEAATLQLVASKVTSSALDGLLRSYEQAVRDPENELVHLYEIRDALSKHFHGEARAKKALGISTNDWKRLGELANVRPIKQGRHRGKHVVRRPATTAELEEARRIAKQMIVALANKV